MLISKSTEYFKDGSPHERADGEAALLNRSVFECLGRPWKTV